MINLLLETKGLRGVPTLLLRGAVCAGTYVVVGVVVVVSALGAVGAKAVVVTLLVMIFA